MKNRPSILFLPIKGMLHSFIMRHFYNGIGVTVVYPCGTVRTIMPTWFEGVDVNEI